MVSHPLFTGLSHPLSHPSSAGLSIIGSIIGRIIDYRIHYRQDYQLSRPLFAWLSIIASSIGRVWDWLPLCQCGRSLPTTWSSAEWAWKKRTGRGHGPTLVSTEYRPVESQTTKADSVSWGFFLRWYNIWYAIMAIFRFLLIFSVQSLPVAWYDFIFFSDTVYSGIHGVESE